MDSFVIDVIGSNDLFSMDLIQPQQEYIPQYINDEVNSYFDYDKWENKEFIKNNELFQNITDTTNIMDTNNITDTYITDTNITDNNIINIENITDTNNIKIDENIINNEKKERIINYNNSSINNNIEKELIINELKTSASVVYNNQQQVANELCNNFKDLSIIVQLAIGLTQSGKTGVMLSLIILMLQNTPINVENIYIITGLSSIDWKKQTHNRFETKKNYSNVLQQNILHNNDLNKLHKLKDKQNVLILIDELHIADSKQNTMNKIFEFLGYHNKNNLFENNIQIVGFSATPSEHVKVFNNWPIHSKIVFLPPGDTYIGTHYFIKHDMIKEYEDLSNNDAIDNLKTFITVSKLEPSYILIRANKNNDAERLKHKFYNLYGDTAEYHIFDCKKFKGKDINDIFLEIKPTRYTFIFIVDMFRCSKTLYLKYVSILYERKTKSKPNIATILQSLVGRACNYHNFTNFVIFSDVNAVNKYNSLWDSQFTTIENKTSKKKLNTDILRENNTGNIQTHKVKQPLYNNDIDGVINITNKICLSKPENFNTSLPIRQQTCIISNLLSNTLNKKITDIHSVDNITRYNNIFQRHPLKFNNSKGGNFLKKYAWSIVDDKIVIIENLLYSKDGDYSYEPNTVYKWEDTLGNIYYAKVEDDKITSKINRNPISFFNTKQL